MRARRVMTVYGPIVLGLLLCEPAPAQTPEPRLRHTLSGHQTAIWDLGFSPDGRTLASAGCGEDPVRLWDVTTGRMRAAIRPMFTSPHYAVYLAFSPDGKALAIGGTHVKAFEKARQDPNPSLDPESQECKFRLWDLNTSQDEVITVRGLGLTSFHFLRYSPDGRTLALGNTFHLGLWDTTAREVRATLEVPIPSLRRFKDININYLIFTCCDFSPDGTVLATGGARPQGAALGPGDTPDACHSSRA